MARSVPVNRSYCFWTVVDGDYAEMAKTVVRSARAVGVFKDFHIWADREIPDAFTHKAGDFQKWGCLFKLTYLRDVVAKLDYEYFVWLDTDSYFVRNPGDILRVLRGSPIHITMECDLTSPFNKRADWWGCPNQKFAQLMKERGVKSNSIFNVNGGFFIVHRDAVATVFDLCFDFFHHCRENGYTFVDEPLLAYAMHMLCGNPYEHTLRETCDLWASDWTGVFVDRLPDAEPWWFTDYFTEEKLAVNPAIVHAMRSKKALVQSSAD
jgi:hypothetical protein